MSALLRIEGLRVAFAPGAAPAVDGVDLALAPGEVLALAGESGAGKSALAAAVLGLLPPPGRIEAGRILFEGRDLVAAPEAELRRLRGVRIGAVFQDASAALDPLATLGAQLVETLRLRRGLAPAAATVRAEALLAEVGLPDPAEALRRHPHRLSGGQRQRGVIALALAGEPALLVADEPTASLDVANRARVLALLGRLCRERGMAALLIGHDLAAAAAVADRVAVMRDGRIVETGPAAEVLRAPTHPWTRALIAAIPRLDGPLEAAEPKAGASDGPRPGSLAAPAVVSSSGGLGALGPADAPPALSLEGVGHAYVRGGLAGRRRARALEGVSLRLAAGESLGLTGVSGSGKSTVARIAAGLLRPSEGRASRAARVQMVFQDPFGSLNPRMRAGEIVAEPIAHLGLSRPGAETRAAVARLLAQVGLPEDAAARRPHAFSGGQRQRIAIARALAARPQLLIADEPTSALDVTVQARVLALLRRLQAEVGFALLLVSHDLAVVRATCARIAVMEGGRVVETGPAAEVLAAPRAEETRRLAALARALEPPAPADPAPGARLPRRDPPG
ncbi:ABC transporter ATP-binding protein [Albimonas sp. CAU 1670]|uniref:nickel ABC transporter ATP-binding protein NikE n=1 Tax=Albimonas sp. CAU 1670 TaxID=3032599 RepID=UPI0023DCDEF1|nr:ABC transporter ATP-binding protein [Albimonas sp. CAU 1670]MDF2232811.1 ABC transporter ATP-binding protein [Albimonas sp. CAU 1670]